MSVQKVKTNPRLLFDIINYLKEVDKPVTSKDILDATSVDINGVPGMAEILQGNVKIRYEDGWYSYKVIFSLFSLFIFFLNLK